MQNGILLSCISTNAIPLYCINPFHTEFGQWTDLALNLDQSTANFRLTGTYCQEETAEQQQ